MDHDELLCASEKDIATSTPPAAPLQLALGPGNTVTTCQHCHATVKTTVKYTSTSRTHIAGALCCLICCCCCIPYCCSTSAKNSDHYCPACERYIGTYEK